MRSVGIARIPNFPASSLLLSTFTLQILALSPNSSASASKIGAIALHGPHQGAQKSTTTGAVLDEIVLSKLDESNSGNFVRCHSEF